MLFLTEDYRPAGEGLLQTGQVGAVGSVVEVDVGGFFVYGYAVFK